MSCILAKVSFFEGAKVEITGTQQSSHPEQDPGEIFLGYFNRNEFNELPWESKREGQLVFTDEGSIVGQGGMILEQKRFPVFIKRAERESKRNVLFFDTHRFSGCTPSAS